MKRCSHVQRRSDTTCKRGSWTRRVLVVSALSTFLGVLLETPQMVRPSDHNLKSLAKRILNDHRELAEGLARLTLRGNVHEGYASIPVHRADRTPLTHHEPCVFL